MLHAKQIREKQKLRLQQLHEEKLMREAAEFSQYAPYQSVLKTWESLVEEASNHAADITSVIVGLNIDKSIHNVDKSRPDIWRMLKQFDKVINPQGFTAYYLDLDDPSLKNDKSIYFPFPSKVEGGFGFKPVYPNERGHALVVSWGTIEIHK
jgi:hypothetical protein